MSRKIISVGYEIPGFSDNYCSLSSSQSLLDADVVVFQPEVLSAFYASEDYQGLPCFDDNYSFKLQDALRHWRSELNTAVNSGKTAFVILGRYSRFYVHTGERQFSGTGRNTRQTNIVTHRDNFQCLPLTLPTVVAKSGSAITFSGNPLFSTFWNQFRQILVYNCYFGEHAKGSDVLFSTKIGNKPLGALYRNSGGGHLVLLPAIPYDRATFVAKQKSGSETWTKNALAFGQSLAAAFLSIDEALRGESASTPPPEWTLVNDYVLKKEVSLQNDIANLEQRLYEATRQQEDLKRALKDEVQLRALLFEKGKPLERAVIRALRSIGFSANEHDDGSVQLDQVIVAPDGSRYIGECEGKDNSAINIDKFRQLTTNIQEDFEREGVTEVAQGVLFGNAERLKPIAERGPYFTEKCLTNAKRTQTTLVRTPDLFPITKYIEKSGDAAFAEKCRSAMAAAKGAIVEFPPVPEIQGHKNVIT